MSSEDTKTQAYGRRQFLQSIFGLGTLLEAQAVKAANPAKFFWADLRTGQIGFPCGQMVPCGKAGSLMKLVTTAALLETKLVSADEKFECRGSYVASHQAVHCLYPHKMLDLTQAIGLSCNGYFAHASKRLTANILFDYAASFGFDKPVGSFSSGKFPCRAAHGLTEYVLGLVEDMEPSALQILRLSALIATRGSVPYLHSAELPVPATKPFALHLAGHTWDVLQQGMQIAGRQGTARELDSKNFLRLAVKTGTTAHGKSYESWITGYFPWDAPRYAFVLRAPSGASYDQAVPQAHKFLFAAEWP